MSNWTARQFASLLLLCLGVLPAVQAQLPCNYSSDDPSIQQGSNLYCEAKLFHGSECREGGTCSNPFEKGCLYTLLNSNHSATASASSNDDNVALAEQLNRLRSQMRVCNSDDGDLSSADNTIFCKNMLADPNYKMLTEHYVEIRVQNTNLLNQWILQIILSELLQVPTTIETAVPGLKHSFYDSNFSPKSPALLSFEFGLAGQQVEWKALNTSATVENGDCSSVRASPGDFDITFSNDTGNYQPCAHVVPEYWSGETYGRTNSEVNVAQKGGVLDKLQALGAVGERGLYVTKFTVEKDPSLRSYLGLAGEENRKKLAGLFHHPTTWQDYCNLVSNSSCSTPDNVATRAPSLREGAFEAGRYYVRGVYTGYFRPTEQNDCESNNATCTGHVGDLPCVDGSFNSLLQPWIQNFDIALSSDGNVQLSNNAYSYTELVEMWEAANQTRSNLITLGQTPDAAHARHINTETEMMRVAFPAPDATCWSDKNFEDNVCALMSSGNTSALSTIGRICDYAPITMQLLKSTGLKIASHPEGLHPELHSPAYEAISRYQISQFDLLEIVKAWIDRQIDTFGFDPRLATCLWVRENLAEVLDIVVPPDYPRAITMPETYKESLHLAALTMGSIATITTFGVSIMVFLRRNTTVMKHAQVDFLFFVLLGLLLLSSSSIVSAVNPSDFSCVFSIWMVNLGYTLELVPIIVKVSALNKLMSAAKKMKRIKIERSHLFGLVAAWFVVAVAGMTVWTVLDPPKARRYLQLLDDKNDQGETLLQVQYYCGSDNEYWLYGAVFIHFMLLMWAAVLAYQTRSIAQRFNESTALAIMIYAQVFFIALKLIIVALPEDSISPVQANGFASVSTATDALMTMLVYFAPKLIIFSNATTSERATGNWQSSHPTGFASDHSQGAPRANEASVADQDQHSESSKEAHVIASPLVANLLDENSTLKAEAQSLISDNTVLRTQVGKLEVEVTLLKTQAAPDEESPSNV